MMVEKKGNKKNKRSKRKKRNTSLFLSIILLISVAINIKIIINVGSLTFFQLIISPFSNIDEVKKIRFNQMLSQQGKIIEMVKGVKEFQEFSILNSYPIVTFQVKNIREENFALPMPEYAKVTATLVDLQGFLIRRKIKTPQIIFREREPSYLIAHEVNISSRKPIVLTPLWLRGRVQVQIVDSKNLKSEQDVPEFFPGMEPEVDIKFTFEKGE